MTKLELIYNVREKLKLNSDDNDTSNEFIAHLIDVKRVKILKQRLAKTPWRAPIEFKQELCMDLEVVNNVNGMSCFGQILRTKIPLPNLIRLRGGNAGVTVRRSDKTALLIDLVDLSRLPFVGNGQFLSQLVYAAFDYDNRLYLVSNQSKHLLMESIQVGAMFEDVETAGDYECGVDSTCDTWERQYPLDVSIIDDVIGLVVQDLSRSINIPKDDNNDAEAKR
jgi:hypothetical protein